MNFVKFFQTIAAVVVIGFTSQAGCSKEGRSLVPVDVSMSSDVQGVTKVVVTATMEGKVVGTQTIEWTGTTPSTFQGGVYVASDVQGMITITATGYSAEGVLIASAPAQTVNVVPGTQSVLVNVVLLRADMPSNDGGMGGSTGNGGAPGVDAAAGGSGGVGSTGGMGGVAMTGGMGGVAMTGGMGGVAMRMWNSAVNVDKDLLGYSYSPVVAMDKAHGNAVVVWEKDAAIKAMRYDGATGKFSAQVVIDEQGEPKDVRVGMDDNGKATAVWSINVDNVAKDGLWESHSPDGLTWSKPVRLHAGKVYYAYPGIGFDVSRNGRARVAWQESVSNINSLWSAYFDGTSWSTAAKVKEGTDSYERYPVVSLDAVGGGALVWIQRSGAVTDNDSVWASRFTGAALGAPTLLETIEEGDCAPGNVSINAAGNGAAVWVQKLTDRRELWVRRYDAGGWKPAEKVFSSTWLDQPYVVSASDGSLTIGWSQGVKNQTDNMMVSRLGAGDTAWSTPMLLEMDNAGDKTDDQPTPRLSADASGVVHAVWRKKTIPTDDEQMVYVSDFSPATGWSPAKKIGGVSRLIALPVEIQSADNGLTLVVFYMGILKSVSSPDLYNVFAATYR
jgi:hypothetical protein